MADYFQGSMGTKTLNQDRRVIDIEEQIMMLDPNRSPFLLLTKKAGKNSRYNPKFHWQEDEHMEQTSTYEGSTETGTQETTIEVGDVELFVEGDVILVPATDEYMVVTDVKVSDDDIDVERGALGSTEANLTNEDELIIIGDASEEGAGGRDINMRKVSTPWNYMQIFKLPWGMTNTMQKQKTYGPDEWARLGRKKSAEFKERIERAFLFGERYKDETGDQPKRYTRGIEKWITTNVEDKGGSSLTEDAFDAWCRDHAFAHGSDRKALLASADLISKISGWAKDNIKTRTPENTYGINVQEYTTPFGVLDIVRHKMFTGDTYGKFGIAVDTEVLGYEYLRDTKLETNIQKNDEDQRKDQYIAEVGLKVGQEKRNAIIKNWE